MKLPFSRHADCRDECEQVMRYDNGVPRCARSCFRLKETAPSPLRITIDVNPAHVEIFERSILMLDTALSRGIESQRLCAAAGNKTAMHIVDEYRAMQRYCGDIMGALALAREHLFSTDGDTDVQKKS